MNIRAFGFRPVLKHLPQCIAHGDAFDALNVNGGAPIDKKGLLLGSATKCNWQIGGKSETWWAAMLVKARDSATFNQLVNQNGVLRLTARQLDSGKLAEVAYCIAHPVTGAGLLACYHQGPGFGVLNAVSRKLISQRTKELRQTALDQLSEADKDYAKKKEAIRKDHTGHFENGFICRTDDLPTLVRDLKEINSVEVTYSGVGFKEGLFSRLRRAATAQTEKLCFPPDFMLDPTMEQELRSDLLSTDYEEVRVAGRDAHKDRRIYSSEMVKNKFLFGETDYDGLLGDLELDLSDWDASIRSSKVVEWLRRHLTNQGIHKLLST